MDNQHPNPTTNALPIITLLSIVFLILIILIFTALCLSWDMISEDYRWVNGPEGRAVAEDLARRGGAKRRD